MCGIVLLTGDGGKQIFVEWLRTGEIATGSVFLPVRGLSEGGGPSQAPRPCDKLLFDMIQRKSSSVGTCW